MANETRVNLLHLLEDIRDGYSMPVEEVIITELVANALDSGGSQINFITDPVNAVLSCEDNGKGMTRIQLKEYHNIASSAKERGKGIGFAGIGAKLSLLVAEKVLTETIGPRNSKNAAEWHLSPPLRAPWQYADFVSSFNQRGVKVSIYLKDRASLLLNEAFIYTAVQKHFHPLLNLFLRESFYRFAYKKDLEFFVNGKKVALPDSLISEKRSEFRIFLGKSRKKYIGVGYFIELDKNVMDADNFLIPGIAVATYGKIIKQGWEWIGIYPKSRNRFYGVVEIPALSEILTTNKADFLSNAGSLKKYYRYRKIVQEQLAQFLVSIGEAEGERPESFPGRMKPLSKEIDATLRKITLDFPELSALVGSRRILARTGNTTDEIGGHELLPNIHDTNAHGREPKGLENIKEAKKDERKLTNRSKQPGIKIAFEEFAHVGAEPPLGRIFEETVFINTSHPAWLKAKSKGFEEYHTLLAVAWVLGGFLGEGKSKDKFLSKFLSTWASESNPVQIKLS